MKRYIKKLDNLSSQSIVMIESSLIAGSISGSIAYHQKYPPRNITFISIGTACLCSMLFSVSFSIYNTLQHQKSSPNYKRRTAGSDSCFFDVSGKYNPDKLLGEEGGYAYARLFINEATHQKKVIIASSNPDLKEATKKHLFFSTLYPELSKDIYFQTFDNNQDYRLFLPYFKGGAFIVAMGKTKTTEDKLKIILSVARALQNSKKHQICVIDLHSGNILINNETNTASLIDGGQFYFIGEQSEYIFKSYLAVLDLRRLYPHIAPEIAGTSPIKAEVSMDVYSFGYMLDDKLIRESKKEVQFYLYLLKYLSLSKNPSDRPSIELIITYLNNIQNHHTTEEIVSVLVKDAAFKHKLITISDSCDAPLSVKLFHDLQNSCKHISHKKVRHNDTNEKSHMLDMRDTSRKENKIKISTLLKYGLYAASGYALLKFAYKTSGISHLRSSDPKVRSSQSLYM